MALDLTTVALVKAKLAKGDTLTGTASDALIQTLITAVSDEAGKYMRRHTSEEKRTETLELRPNRRWLSLDGFPIVGPIILYYAPSRDFSGLSPMDPSQYDLWPDRGQVYFKSLAAWYTPGFVQVIYTGGMALDTATFVERYPRIADAVSTEVVNRLNRARNPEGNLNVLGASTIYNKELTPLKDLYAALDHNRRIAV